MSSPRIIAGKAKSFRLKAVPGDTTRPVTDQVKEALFNIIGLDIEDATFFDVFGGTGSVGIEALSRGAAWARFLDLNRAAVDTIKTNLKSTGLMEFGEARQANAFTYLARTPDRAFDYIYIAPPQYKGMWRKALEIVDANIAWASPDAWVIAQIHPVEFEEFSLNHLVEFERRHYGSTLLIFYRLKDTDTSETNTSY
jgi:16S rRNA (guanine966-N2)-methyltransferase